MAAVALTGPGGVRAEAPRSPQTVAAVGPVAASDVLSVDELHLLLGPANDVLDAEQAAALGLLNEARALAEAAAAPKVEPPPASIAAPVSGPPVKAPAVARAAPPATCPTTHFCYPRVGIAGAIIPYDDCSGSSDVGMAIRSVVCVSPTYLAAHAYTQFGRISGWRAGDVVFAYGKRYVIFDAFTQQGCVPPARAIAPLSLQTSLTPTTCGPILVVQARPE